MDISYLVEEMEEAERLSAADTKHLRNLEITLRNSVLPQHEIESRAGSHIPNREEIERFEKIIPIKKGMYNSSEDKIIANNWEEFCKLHKWNSKKVQPFVCFRNKTNTYIRSKKQRRKFVQFLADGLPNRTLYSVYHRFRNLYTERLQRRFQPQEDKMIMDHLENNELLDEKRKYVDLAKVLKRSRVSIWRRYKILKRKRKEREED